MVALWLRHDNDHHQGHFEGGAPGIEAARGDTWAQFEYRGDCRARGQCAQPAGAHAGSAAAVAGDAAEVEVQGHRGAD